MNFRNLTFLVFCVIFLYQTVYGQQLCSFEGIVLDERQDVLVGASVLILPDRKGTITDINGKFSINNLARGYYTVEISFIGYETHKAGVYIHDKHFYKVALEPSSLTLQEVVVKDDYVTTRKKKSSLNLEVVNDTYLKENMGGSLMKSLERLGGVNAINIGSGQSKPMIRGLGFNRVVVVENNIKHEGQQWGADHGLEIDQYAIDNIEVIKGPSSLMYGSDAIGGIIDMKNRKIPEPNTFGGKLDLSGKSNNNSLGLSASAYVRKKAFFADVRATMLNYGDYKVPADSIDIYSYRAPLDNHYLRNTAGKEADFHLRFGWIKEHFQTRFFVSSVNTKSGFFANAHGLEPRNVDTDLHDASNRDIQEPYQLVHHFKINNTSLYQWNAVHLELDLGFQNNFRQEWSPYVSHGYMPAVYPEDVSFNPNLEREFEKKVYTGNLKLSYQPTEKWHFYTGINSDFQDNKIDGRGFILPAYKRTNWAAYALTKYTLNERSHLQLGVRYDFGNVRSYAYSDWFASPWIQNGDTAMLHLTRAQDLDKDFSNLTYALGYNFNVENWSLKANVGKSFRMPIVKELSANGVNYHHFSYEVGNANLSPEVSYQLDAGLEYISNKVAIGATPFVNYFSNYIYLNPTAKHDRLYGNGNQVFEYTESEVLRYGGELHAHYDCLKTFRLGLVFEYVYSEQLSGKKKGYTLPFSPPPSVIFNIKYRKDKIAFLKDTYVSLDYRLTASQEDIVPPERVTEGYQLVNLGLGSTIKLKGQELGLTIQIRNLLNTKYFNHISFYRLINVPEPGRDIIVHLSIPFSGRMKEKV